MVMRLQPVHSRCLVTQFDRDDAGVVRKLEDLIRCEVAKALHVANGNRRKAAELLDIPERTLYRKIEMYELNGRG